MLPVDTLAIWRYIECHMSTMPTENDTSQVIALLGGRKVFPRSIQDSADLKRALRSGFPFAAYEAFLKTIELSSTDLAALLGIASRTLSRRKTSRKLMPVESDRLYRVAYITSMAVEVFASLEKARTWLQKENQALGGDSPISCLDTEIGERWVEELLTRINYGIYS